MRKTKDSYLRRVRLIDTHSHIYLSEFEEDRAEMLDRAKASGIQRIFMPNIDSDSIPGMFRLAEQYPDFCLPMMGLHPCSVANRYAEDLKVVEHWLGKKKFHAVGEIGVDLYWDRTYLEQQKDAFRHQVRLAKKYDLPVVIHTRNSFDEAFQIIREEQDGKLRGIFHCFSGSAEQARQIIGLGGFKMGIGGVLTFRNSGLDTVIPEIGIQHLVLETDAPYLSPVPHRGKRNEPAFLSHVSEKLSQLLSMTPEEVAEITSVNAEAVFGK